MVIISVANQKGGVAKSTTSQALATIFNSQGKKALAIDLDPQGNLSLAMGANVSENPTIYNVLKGELTASDILQHTPSGDILPSNILLSGADTEFTSTGREYLLKEAISAIKEHYDYVVIDCPPTLSVLTINAFVSSDFVIVPSLADAFSLHGMGQLNDTIKSVKKYCNSNLKIAGILLTKFVPRNTLSFHIKETLHGITEKMDTILFKTYIRNSVAIQEAQLQQDSLLDYDPKANALMDYIEFVKELESVINE